MRDPDAWLGALPGVEAVSHQAARVGLGVSPADVRGYVEDNDLGTAVGLWAMHEAGFAGRLVVASSMVVYGEGAYSCPTHGPVGASTSSCGAAGGRLGSSRPARCAVTTSSRNWWTRTPGSTRATPTPPPSSTRSTCRRCSVARPGVPVTMLRYHNVYGPRMPRDTPYAGVAAIFRSALERGEAPKVFEDGGQRRDFVHVADVSAANVAALTASEPVVGAFNVASGVTAHRRRPGNHAGRRHGWPRARRDRRVPIGRRPPRHRLARSSGTRSRFPGPVGFAEGMVEFATAPLRAAVG